MLRLVEHQQTSLVAEPLRNLQQHELRVTPGTFKVPVDKTTLEVRHRFVHHGTEDLLTLALVSDTDVGECWCYVTLGYAEVPMSKFRKTLYVETSISVWWPRRTQRKPMLSEIWCRVGWPVHLYHFRQQRRHENWHQGVEKREKAYSTPAPPHSSIVFTLVFISVSHELKVCYLFFKRQLKSICPQTFTLDFTFHHMKMIKKTLKCILKYTLVHAHVHNHDIDG